MKFFGLIRRKKTQAIPSQEWFEQRFKELTETMVRQVSEVVMQYDRDTTDKFKVVNERLGEHENRIKELEDWKKNIA